MIQICAWCQREGKVTTLAEVPGDREGVSHGICDRHRAEIRTRRDARRTLPAATASPDHEEGQEGRNG